MKPYAILNGIEYQPLQPQRDWDGLASQGNRLILHHGSPCSPQSEIKIAPKNEITAGWVIGMVCDEQNEMD